MSENDGFLKLALVAGAVLIVLAGGLYLSTLSEDGEAVNVPGKAVVKPPEDLSGGADQRPVLKGIPARVLATMTEPKVSPRANMAAIEAVLEAALPDLSACYAEHAGFEADDDGTAFVRFRLDVARNPSDLGVLLHGPTSPAMETCVRAIVESRDYSAASPGTLVAWPLRYRGRAGLGLR